MKIIKIIILAIFLAVFSNQQAIASMYDDDSCVKGQSVIVRILNDLTSFGLFAAYSSQFSMTGAGSSTSSGVDLCSADYYPSNCSGHNCSGEGVTHSSKGCVTCGSAQCVNSCDSSDSTGCSGGLTCSSTCNSGGGVEFCYSYISGFDVTTFEPTYTKDCNWGRSGWNKLYLLPPASMQVAQVGDTLCVQFWTLLGYQSIGCKYLPDCSQFSTNSSCYVDPSCSSAAYQNSKSLIGITGAIMQCVNGSIAKLFTVLTCNDGSSTYSTNYFPTFQIAMRQAIRAAITLYFILFGIKMVLGGEMPSKGEFFNFGAKYILVLYFSVGIYTSTAKNGEPVYTDGINTIMIPLFQGGSSALANIVYSAGGATGLCSYDPNSYPAGYGYLAMWDSLDCRLLYYLGIGEISSLINTAKSGGTLSYLSLGAPTILNLMIPSIFSFQIIFAVFLLIFFVFLLSIVIYFLNIVVLCTIGMAILIYLAPVFVPMALFQPTKGYFDGWLKLLTSYALQPMIVAAYMAMMLTVFDQAVFGNCQFSNQSINWKVGGVTKVIPFFELCDPNDLGSGCTAVTTDTNATSCTNTIGYIVNPINSNSSLTQTVSALFFDIVILNPQVVGNMLSPLVTLVLFAFLFYKFAELLSAFAAELTGGTNIGALAGNPMGLVNKAALLVSAAIKARMGDKKGAAEDLKKATSDSGAQGKSRAGGSSSPTGPAGGGGGSGASGSSSLPMPKGLK